MPNYMHGIIVINKLGGDKNLFDVQFLHECRDAINRVFIRWLQTCRDAINRVSTDTPQPKIGGVSGINNSILHVNLSTIIRWYKGRVKFESRNLKPDFAWQARFHDHIIRNDKSFYTIRQYIKDNSNKWMADKFYCM